MSHVTVPVTALAAALLAACGAPRPQTPAGPERPAVVERRGTEGYARDIERRGEYSEIGHPIPSDAPAAFRALADAYIALGIPAELIDTEARIIGNAQFHARRVLGGIRLGRYFDCGRSVAGANADSYALTIDIRSQVTAAVEGSRLRTWIRATATAPAQAREAATVTCVSHGALEERIASEVVRRLTSS